MTPLPTNPTVVALVDENGVLIRIATNVAEDLAVVTTTSKDVFNTEALGKPFNFTPLN
jgi:hypothetical protein